MSLALALAALLMQPAAPIGTPPAPALPQTRWPVRQHDATLADFRFDDGAVLPQLRMHYLTLGQPHRGPDGRIDNAILILHGTGGSGAQFLQPQFADELFGPGKPLDITRYYLVMPDNVGHGGSSKPSDGMRMRFPKYDYADMVRAQHRLLTEALGVDRLRLVFGTSMGCMHAFQWGEMYPGFARALMPMACQAAEIGGLNRMWRKMAIDGIMQDPAWRSGDYTAEPAQGLRTAVSLLTAAGGAPLYLQSIAPTRVQADAYVVDRVAKDVASRDANDLIYQLEASRTYDPSRDLEKITVPVTWINSADDFINPRNFPMAAAAAGRMPKAKFVLLPESIETRGHGSHTWARLWDKELAALLARSER